MEQDYIPEGKAIKCGDPLAAAANAELIWHPLPGQVRPRSVIVLGMFTVIGSGVTGCGRRTR
jgi:hypothetical protein